MSAWSPNFRNLRLRLDIAPRPHSRRSRGEGWHEGQREAYSRTSCPLLRQGGVQRAQLLEPPRQLVALRVVLAVGEVFFGVSDIARQQIEIEILPRSGTIGEHGQTSGSHLGKATHH